VFQVGVGLYSLTDAARLIGAPRRQLKRWLFGYDYSHKSETTTKKYHSDPLWRTAFAGERDPELTIGFADLLESRVVNEFVRHGVDLQIVRRCLQKARELLGTQHPLTHSRFCTDGKTIYAEALADMREQDLLDLRSSQFAFKEVIKPSLYAGIEYEGGLATRWYPLARNRSVVIDPDLQFGKPVLAEQGVPTAAVFASYQAEDEKRNVVARIFDITPAQVDAAVRFESSLARALSH
jgi:uncharacterized protein (DUF433 family)